MKNRIEILALFSLAPLTYIFIIFHKVALPYFFFSFLLPLLVWSLRPLLRNRWNWGERSGRQGKLNPSHKSYIPVDISPSDLEPARRRYISDHEDEHQRYLHSEDHDLERDPHFHLSEISTGEVTDQLELSSSDPLDTIHLDLAEEVIQARWNDIESDSKEYFIKRDGVLVFNFGKKHFGESVEEVIKSDMNYLSRMLKAEFPNEVCKQILSLDIELRKKAHSVEKDGMTINTKTGEVKSIKPAEEDNSTEEIQEDIQDEWTDAWEVDEEEYLLTEKDGELVNTLTGEVVSPEPEITTPNYKPIAITYIA